MDAAVFLTNGQVTRVFVGTEAECQAEAEKWAAQLTAEGHKMQGGVFWVGSDIFTCEIMTAETPQYG